MLIHRKNNLTVTRPYTQFTSDPRGQLSSFYLAVSVNFFQDFELDRNNYTKTCKDNFFLIFVVACTHQRFCQNSFCDHYVAHLYMHVLNGL